MGNIKITRVFNPVVYISILFDARPLRALQIYRCLEILFLSVKSTYFWNYNEHTENIFRCAN